MSVVIVQQSEEKEKKSNFGNYGKIGWGIFIIMIAITFFASWLINAIFGLLFGWIMWMLPFIFLGIGLLGFVTGKSFLAILGWLLTGTLLLFTSILAPLFNPLISGVGLLFGL